ncbi:MAG: ABC transporter permease, partial [Acidobacteriota bacterium]
MDTLWQDLRFGLRVLWKNPVFTAVAVFTLVLGISANAAIYSVVKGLLLFALPYPDDHELIHIWAANPERGFDGASVSYPNYLDWRAGNQTFQDIALYDNASFNLTGIGEPERISGLLASANLFAVLERDPAVGRAFVSDEDRAGADAVAVLSHGLWQRRFAGDPHILGKTLSLDGEAHTIIGIMPADFFFPSRQTDIWVPHRLNPEDAPRGSGRFGSLGRLKNGVPIEAATSDLKTIAGQLAQEYPNENKGWTVSLVPLRRQMADADMRRIVLTMYLAVVFVLLIACANVANLLLARAGGREREIALRMAMGGGRRRLMKQLMTESFLLAALGGIGGMIGGYWFLKALLLLAPEEAANVDQIRMDMPVLLYTVGITFLTGLLFGLAPALQGTRSQIQNSLKEGAQSHTGGPRHRLLKTLVVVEVALALMLLVSGGLMVRSFMAQMGVDPGFDPKNLLSARITLPASKYAESPQRDAFFKEVLARVRAIPGVRAAGAVQSPPLGGSSTFSGITIEGKPPAQPGERPLVGYMIITPDYFQAIGIPLLIGRLFTEQDGQGHPAA